jgi:EAL domain-containing protein (putative c-di-GMP-specific phosphodiesterase class I)
VVAEEQARELRSLLFAGGLAMYVQPVVDLRDGALAKVEALARMIRPDGRVIGPGAFLPLLGEADLSLLFRNGLQLALRRLARWDADGLRVDVAINLPPRTMLDAQCPQWIADALREHGIAPQRLTLELLEHQSLDAAAQDAAVARLAPLGVQLSMDDLGSGYSSLQRLAALPFTSIKADQGLLVRLREQPLQTLTMLRTIIQMGADLERGVVVEGLEDDDMVEAARWLGAPYGQGYALARPMPAAALADWWRERRGALLPDDSAPRSALGALAWKWARRDAAGATLHDCPLHGFLLREAPHDTALHDCHARLHAGHPGARRELVERLAARVQAAAAARAVSAG